MKLPEFTAEASLYRTSGRYRVSASQLSVSPNSEAIVPAYLPGPDTRCNSCMEDCATADAYCTASATALLAGCVFPPACPFAAAAAGKAMAACQAAFLSCNAICSLPRPELFGSKPLGESPCCPKVCGFTHPFAMGEGCCDEGEHCVDSFDPNARQGCCPSDQSVCGGKCCAKVLKSRLEVLEPASLRRSRRNRPRVRVCLTSVLQGGLTVKTSVVRRVWSAVASWAGRHPVKRIALEL